MYPSINNFLKREDDFDTRDKLLAIFTYARIHGVRVDQACNALGYDRDMMQEAIRYRYAVCDRGKSFISNYAESVAEGCGRLAGAN